MFSWLETEAAKRIGSGLTGLWLGLLGSSVADLGNLALEKLVPSIPTSWLLRLVGILTGGTLLLALVCLVLYGRLRATRERKFLFGVGWDKEATPRCSACDTVMHMYADPRGDGLKCPNCGALVWLFDENKEQVHLKDARLLAAKLFGKTRPA